MNSFRYYSDLDRHPFTGERKVNFKAKVTEKESLKKFFSETVGTKWIQNVTPGKIYEIYKVEGYGDCVDFYFKDDSGKEQYLADFFFEEVEDD